MATPKRHRKGLRDWLEEGDFLPPQSTPAATSTQSSDTGRASEIVGVGRTLYFTGFVDGVGQLYQLSPHSIVPMRIDIDLASETIPHFLTEFKGDLYFTAATDEVGSELFRLSAGRTTPTVFDLNPGPDSSGPRDFTEVDGKLYFNAFGAEVGIYEIAHRGDTPRLFLGGFLATGLAKTDAFFFSGFDPETGFELYRLSPGDDVPTLIDINEGAESSNPGDLTAFGKDLYFQATTEETGIELYRISAGSDTPTLIDINQGEEDSFPQQLTLAHGDLYFDAFTEENGRELYRISRGGDTPVLIDINEGSESSDPIALTEFGGDLYFTAHTEETGYELFKVARGSDEATLIDINPGPADAIPLQFTESRGKLYFIAGTEEHGFELHQLSRGSDDPVLFDLIPGEESFGNVDLLTAFKGDLYFNATAPDTGQRGFYRFSPRDETLTLIDISQATELPAAC